MTQSSGPVKILLVDDEQDILEFFGYNLSKEGFELATAPDGQHAIEIATRIRPDLIVLDIMMPNLDGIETCRQLKSIPACQDSIILFLTAGSARFAREAMLKAKADDFLLKPLRPKIFITKVFSVLHRFGKYPATTNEPFILEINGIRLNRRTHEFTDQTRFVQLKELEFELLWLLASHPNQTHSTFSLKKILQQTFPEPDIRIKKAILRLRDKIGEEYIKTIKGLGYRFECKE